MKKTYRICGTRSIDGHAPGEEFEADFDPGTEAYHVEAGHLEIVTTKATKQQSTVESAKADEKEKVNDGQ